MKLPSFQVPDAAMAILVAIVAAIPLGIVWVVISLWLYFGNGGDFGGYGAGPADTATWVGGAQVALLIAAAAADISIGIATFRGRLRRQR